MVGRGDRDGGGISSGSVHRDAIRKADGMKGGFRYVAGIWSAQGNIYGGIERGGGLRSTKEHKGDCRRANLRVS